MRVLFAIVAAFVAIPVLLVVFTALLGGWQ